jgi:hypothetical protein
MTVCRMENVESVERFSEEPVRGFDTIDKLKPWRALACLTYLRG